MIPICKLIFKVSDSCFWVPRCRCIVFGSNWPLVMSILRQRAFSIIQCCVPYVFHFSGFRIVSEFVWMTIVNCLLLATLIDLPRWCDLCIGADVATGQMKIAQLKLSLWEVPIICESSQTYDAFAYWGCFTASWHLTVAFPTVWTSLVWWTWLLRCCGSHYLCSGKAEKLLFFQTFAHIRLQIVHILPLNHFTSQSYLPFSGPWPRVVCDCYLWSVQCLEIQKHANAKENRGILSAMSAM